MQKAELLNWLQQAYQQWQAFLDEIPPGRMEQPGANGDWSVKDLVAHLNGWQIAFNRRLQAAQSGAPEPPPPWPAHLQDEDAINAWIYETNRARTLHDVLQESRRLFDELLAIIKSLPDDVRIESNWRLVHLGDQRFSASEFFDHFRDDHEASVRAWLAQGDHRPQTA
ncbi:MAG: ClbS/DfsB family four-helix bundle protein [Anaerolineales bacterium]|nr:ClbS/DfsB family four-helix bundle protein [Anaerolineales bacterium]